MAITIGAPVEAISQREFGDVAYDVMKVVFSIQKELGRFFEERIYKNELAFRIPGTQLEVPIDVRFQTFHKRYYLDVLIGRGAIFEFKAVEKLTGIHSAQLVNYLLLCQLNHGKLINIRTETVEHRFVNAHGERKGRFQVSLDTSRWNPAFPGAAQLIDVVNALVGELGAGLEISLYEEAILHFFGGADRLETFVGVLIDGRLAGQKRIRCIAPGVAVKFTTFEMIPESHEDHACRMLRHLDMTSIAWVNIGLKKLTFILLERPPTS